MRMASSRRSIAQKSWTGSASDLLRARAARSLELRDDRVAQTPQRGGLVLERRGLFAAGEPGRDDDAGDALVGEAPTELGGRRRVRREHDLEAVARAARVGAEAREAAQDAADL